MLFNVIRDPQYLGFFTYCIMYLDLQHFGVESIGISSRCLLLRQQIDLLVYIIVLLLMCEIWGLVLCYIVYHFV